jgi:hypothetical protein
VEYPRERCVWTCILPVSAHADPLLYPVSDVCALASCQSLHTRGIQQIETFTYITVVKTRNMSPTSANDFRLTKCSCRRFASELALIFAAVAMTTTCFMAATRFVAIETKERIPHTVVINSNAKYSSHLVKISLVLIIHNTVEMTGASGPCTSLKKRIHARWHCSFVCALVVMTRGAMTARLNQCAPLVCTSEEC